MRNINITLDLSILVIYLISDELTFIPAYPLLAVMFIMLGIENLHDNKRQKAGFYFIVGGFILFGLTGRTMRLF